MNLMRIFFINPFIKQIKKSFENDVLLKPKNKAIWYKYNPKKSYSVFLKKKIVLDLKIKFEFPWFSRRSVNGQVLISWPRSNILTNQLQR